MAMQFITRIKLILLQKWWQLYIPIRLRLMGVEIGEGARFYGMPIIRITPGSSIHIGKRVVLCSDSRFTDLGVNHPVILRTLRPNAHIAIGDDTGISGGAICAAVGIDIGKQCLVGANVTISDTDFHATKHQGRRFNKNEIDISALPIAVEENVFIGTNSIILKGTSIGRNSVIGAMTLVSKNVPPNEIWAGVPAKFVKIL